MSDGRYLILTCSSNGVFARIANAMEKAELITDPRFVTHDTRFQHIHELNALVAEWVAAADPKTLMDALTESGAPYSIALTIEDIFADPQYAARDNIVSVAHPKMGTVKMAGVVPKLSLTPGAITGPAPELGEHTTSVLQEFLGLSPAEIDVLREAEVI